MKLATLSAFALLLGSGYASPKSLRSKGRSE